MAKNKIKVLEDFYTSGKLKSHKFYIGRNFHNPNGPARLWFTKGLLVKKEFWFNGNQYESLKSVQRQLKLSCLK